MKAESVREWHCNSVEALIEAGSTFAQKLVKSSVVCLFGDLGAGKTTFIKGIAIGLGLSANVVQSPTFTYLNIYDSTPPLYHFDLYRLHNADEFLAMGFDEYLLGDGICCIEWSERIAGMLPSNRQEIWITALNSNTRHLQLRTFYDQ